MFSFLLLSLGSSGSVVFGQKVGKFLVWRLGENGFLPQIRGQVGVRLCNGSISCLGCKVLKKENETTDLKERVDQLEECCNCTKSEGQ